MSESFKIAILTSGKSRGSNFEAIMRHLQEVEIPVRVQFVVITRNDAPIRRRADFFGVKYILLDNRKSFEQNLMTYLDEYEVNLLVLAGFMRKLSHDFLQSFRGDVINIHPALLPKYGGKGMYGMRVHEKVFESGETESGVTIHIVNDDYDQGPIIAQRTVSISDCKHPEEIAQRVLEIEHSLYPEIIEKLAREHLKNLHKLLREEDNNHNTRL